MHFYLISKWGKIRFSVKICLIFNVILCKIYLIFVHFWLKLPLFRKNYLIFAIFLAKIRFKNEKKFIKIGIFLHVLIKSWLKCSFLCVFDQNFIKFRIFVHFWSKCMLFAKNFIDFIEKWVRGPFVRPRTKGPQTKNSGLLDCQQRLLPKFKFWRIIWNLDEFKNDLSRAYFLNLVSIHTGCFLTLTFMQKFYYYTGWCYITVCNDYYWSLNFEG